MTEPTNAMIHASCATVSIWARVARGQRATHNANGDGRQGERIAEDVVEAKAVAHAVIHLLKAVGRLERGHLCTGGAVREGRRRERTARGGLRRAGNAQQESTGGSGRREVQESGEESSE